MGGEAGVLGMAEGIVEGIRVELYDVGGRVLKGRMAGKEIPGICVFDGRRGDDGESPT